MPTMRLLLLLLVALLLTVPLLLALGEPQSQNRNRNRNHYEDEGEGDRDELTVEVEGEEEEEGDATPVFVATHEWQVVQEGQPIPPGLHVRMNLQTGLREAKLLDDRQEEEEEEKKEKGQLPEEESEGGLKEEEEERAGEEEEEEGKVGEEREKEERTRGETKEEEKGAVKGDDEQRKRGTTDPAVSVTEEHTKDSGAVEQTAADVGVQLTGESPAHEETAEQPPDEGPRDSPDGERSRRAHYLGRSDRRGIINKRRKVFTQEQLSAMLQTPSATDSVDPHNLPGIAFSDSTRDDDASDEPGERARESPRPKITLHSHAGASDDSLPVTRHEDVEAMLRHTRVLASADAASTSIPELLHALEELEDYAHHIDNARDLNVIGGLVLVVRLLNHTHPDVRGHAAHVIGAAVQR